MTPPDPAREAAILARLGQWPEAMLTPAVIRDEPATDTEDAVRWPCLRHEEESHVAFEYQQGVVTGQQQTEYALMATVEMRTVVAFCANCSPTLAEAIAAAPSDIRYLLAQLAAARARAERAEGALAKRVGEVRAAGLLAYRKAKGEACRLDFQVRCYSCEREYNEVVDGILAALAARGE